MLQIFNTSMLQASSEALCLPLPFKGHQARYCVVYNFKPYNKIIKGFVWSFLVHLLLDIQFPVLLPKGNFLTPSADSLPCASIHSPHRGQKIHTHISALLLDRAFWDIPLNMIIFAKFFPSPTLPLKKGFEISFPSLCCLNESKQAMRNLKKKRIMFIFSFITNLSVHTIQRHLLAPFAMLPHMTNTTPSVMLVPRNFI